MCCAQATSSPPGVSVPSPAGPLVPVGSQQTLVLGSKAQEASSIDFRSNPRVRSTFGNLIDDPLSELYQFMSGFLGSETAVFSPGRCQSRVRFGRSRCIVLLNGRCAENGLGQFFASCHGQQGAF